MNAEPHIKAKLPRLEFGKFCSWPDGPILSGDEHGILGSSPDFPQELIKSLGWNKLTLGTNAPESESHLTYHYEGPEKRKYGTVIRPVRYKAEDGTTRYGVLGYQRGMRSEGGTFKENRYYHAAHYVLDPTGTCSPSEIHHALGKFDRGIVRGQPIEPAIVPLEAHPLAEMPATEKFLSGASKIVNAGLPVEIATSDEAKFFQHADLLWKELPEELRPFMSTGWNVSQNLGDTLSVSFSPKYSPTKARYLADAGKWEFRPALKIEEHADRLVAFRKAVQSGDTTLPEMKNVVTATIQELPEFPDLGDAKTRQFFHSFSIKTPLIVSAAAKITDSNVTENPSHTTSHLHTSPVSAMENGLLEGAEKENLFARAKRIPHIGKWTAAVALTTAAAGGLIWASHKKEEHARSAQEPQSQMQTR